METDWIKILLTLGTLQGIMLLVAINRLKDRNRQANQILSVFLGLLSLTLWARVNYKTEWIEQLLINIGWILDTVVFLYVVVLYLYLRTLLTNRVFYWRADYIYFLPAICYIPFSLFFQFANYQTWYWNIGGLTIHYPYIFQKRSLHKK